MMRGRGVLAGGLILVLLAIALPGPAARAAAGAVAVLAAPSASAAPTVTPTVPLPSPATGPSGGQLFLGALLVLIGVAGATLMLGLLRGLARRRPPPR